MTQVQTTDQKLGTALSRMRWHQHKQKLAERRSTQLERDLAVIDEAFADRAMEIIESHGTSASLAAAHARNDVTASAALRWLARTMERVGARPSGIDHPFVIEFSEQIGQSAVATLAICHVAQMTTLPHG